MRLTVLGAGPAYTNRPGSSGAAYLVRHGETSVLLDLGQGSFPRLAAEIEPSLLSAVIISHLHPDHFIDLVPLRHYLRYEFSPSRRVLVIAPRALAERVDALHAQPGFTAESLDFIALSEGIHVVGGLAVQAGRVTHTDDSYGFRIAPADGGPGLVYSGDCGRTADLEPLVRAGDTLLTEISFGAGPVPSGALHLDGPAIGALAAETSVRRVLLTHIQMGFDHAAAVDTVVERFAGPVQLVSPGEEFAL